MYYRLSIQSAVDPHFAQKARIEENIRALTQKQQGLSQGLNVTSTATTHQPPPAFSQSNFFCCNDLYNPRTQPVFYPKQQAYNPVSNAVKRSIKPNTYSSSISMNIASRFKNKYSKYSCADEENLQEFPD